MTAVKSGGGRPKGYRLSDGSRVPGVTTITGRFKDGAALIAWAHRCGLDGIDINRVRDDAADAGKMGHQWIEDTIHDRELTEFPLASDDMMEKAGRALMAFKDWRSRNDVEFLETELPLVSEQYRFGGTLDALARIGGRLRLVDFKTGNRVYPEHLAQLGGYSILLAEHGRAIEGADLLRLDKEHGSFAHHEWPLSVLQIGEQAFFHMRELYDLDLKLKKAAA